MRLIVGLICLFPWFIASSASAEDWEVEINKYGCASSPFEGEAHAYRRAREAITREAQRHQAICENAGGAFTLSFQNGLCNSSGGSICHTECLVWGSGFCDSDPQ